MSASQAKLGKGITFKRGDGLSPEGYTAIPEILELSGPPAGAPDRIDVTNHDSTGLYREFITGLINQEEISGRCNYIKHAQQTGLRTDRDAGTKRSFQLVIPSVGGDETVTFYGRVTKWNLKTPINAQQELEFAIQPDGSPTWA